MILAGTRSAAVPAAGDAASRRGRAGRPRPSRRGRRRSRYGV